MKEMLLRNFAKPLLERLGTMAAAYLIARGLDSDLVAQLINGLMAALLVGIDLLWARSNRNSLIGHNGGPSLREAD
ncbi:hypothetical protein [Aminobacter sp. BE322]|uniref:hypothetical protein n=1 Tax=unclassified Aminobacter TaxID=2644704 RepID=UPI003D1A2A36